MNMKLPADAERVRLLAHGSGKSIVEFPDGKQHVIDSSSLYFDLEEREEDGGQIYYAVRPA